MNFDDIFLTKSEYRTLKLYAKNFYPKNQLPEHTGALTLKGLVGRGYAIDHVTSGHIDVCAITDDGKAYLEWRKSKRRTEWFKSVWLPIIVAFITAVITAVVTTVTVQLLQSMFQSLSK